MDLSEKFANVTLHNGSPQTKREDYLDWQEYFMATAFLAAKRSKDPAFQVGACIVNKENRIVGVGYNGMPTGCSDDEFPWGKNTPSALDSKFLYVCHAEMNAILNKNSADVKDCTIYVGLFPCNECAKMIIQSGIKEIVYLSDKGAHKPIYIASKRMLNAAGVKYWKCKCLRLDADASHWCVPGQSLAFKQFKPRHDKIEIDFAAVDWNKMASPSK